MRGTGVIDSIDQTIATLEVVLAYLDRMELQIPAVHVSMALDTLTAIWEETSKEVRPK